MFIVVMLVLSVPASALMHAAAPALEQMPGTMLARVPGVPPAQCRTILTAGKTMSIRARQWFHTARIANSALPECARSSRHNGSTSRECVVACGDETWLDCYR